MRTCRTGGHQPGRRYPLGLAGRPVDRRRERDVNHPAQVRVLHSPAGGVEAGSGQHIEAPRGCLGMGSFPSSTPEADLVALPRSPSRTGVPAARDERLTILVVAGNIEAVRVGSVARQMNRSCPRESAPVRPEHHTRAAAAPARNPPAPPKPRPQSEPAGTERQRPPLSKPGTLSGTKASISSQTLPTHTASASRGHHNGVLPS